MFILNFLPDIVIHLILLTGIIGLIFSFFLNLIPSITLYKTLIQVVSIFLIVIGVWYEGGIAKDKEYRAQIQEYEKKVLESEIKSEQYNQTLKDIIRSNENKIKSLTASNKKKLKDLSDRLNQQCTIETPVINIINDAARGIK